MTARDPSAFQWRVRPEELVPDALAEVGHQAATERMTMHFQDIEDFFALLSEPTAGGGGGGADVDYPAHYIGPAGEDALEIEDADIFAVKTFITTDNGLRFEQDESAVTLSTNASGEGIEIARATTTGPGTVADYPRLDVFSGGSARVDLVVAAGRVLRLGFDDASGEPFLRAFPDGDGAFFFQGVAASDVSSVLANFAGSFVGTNPPCLAWWIDEANDVLKLQVLKSDGTIKTGEVALF